MPLILEANYSKKIGLPHYSSHQFMVIRRYLAIYDLVQRLFKRLRPPSPP